MDRTLRFMLLSALLLAAALLVQSTVLEHAAIAGVKPDLALIVLVYVAVQGGSMVGQVCGFAAGLVQDLLSLPPLGLNAFVRTAVGFLYGRLQGALASSSVLASVVLVLGATVLKGALFWVITGILASSYRPSLTGRSLVELAYNSLLAPFVFAALSRVKALRAAERRDIVA